MTEKEMFTLLIDALGRVEEKVDQSMMNQAEMKTTLTQNTVDLKHHIKRTDLLEKDMRNRDKDNKARVDQVQKDVKPIREHVARLKWLGALVVGGLGLIALLQKIGYWPF